MSFMHLSCKLIIVNMAQINLASCQKTFSLNIFGFGNEMVVSLISQSRSDS